MNLLTIGNSFSQDATRYIHDIARAAGDYLDVINAEIGGCSLERHYRNMLGDICDYELECNGHWTNFKITLKEALLNRDWDVITIQQASHYSFRKDTYTPYIFELVAYIRKLAPRAKVLFQQTWAYENGSDRLHRIAGYDTADAMFADIEKAYREIAEEAKLDGIIPSGAMLLYLSKNGIPKVHRDTFHATLGASRYALGLLWYHMLTGKPVADNTFCDFDEPVSDEEIRIIKAYVDSVAPLF